MSYVADNYDLWEAYDRKQAQQLEKLPEWLKETVVKSESFQERLAAAKGTAQGFKELDDEGEKFPF